MKIFFPIIAALILLCLGSCGYANYCKQPVEHNEDEEVDRHEEVYSLSKPDRPYLTPHYQELLIIFFEDSVCICKNKHKTLECLKILARKLDITFRLYGI